MSTPNKAPIGANLPEPKAPRAKPTTSGLFRKNLLSMAAWYRAKDNGPEMGSYVVIEVVLRDVAACFEAASDGKEWTPPN